MTEINYQNPESVKGKHSALEADIERLSKEIVEKRNLLEHKNLSERELVKQILHPLMEQPLDQQAQTSVAQSTAPTGKTILPDYLKDSPEEIKLQVEELVDLVFHQGIMKAVKEAQKAGGFVLDAFHDALTDKLHEELKRRKLI
ncbi:MAG: hypothetical protein AAB496_00365 [Patescibacteria group bacterium]